MNNKAQDTAQDTAQDKLSDLEIKWLKEIKSIDGIVYPDGSYGELKANVLLL